MRIINIVGAFDRHNYGDILFPLVHSALIKAECGAGIDIKYYSITQSDLTSDGGVVTQSIKKLIQSSPASNDVVVMCGGDILAVDWPTMIGHVYSPAVYFLVRAIRRVFGFKFANYIVKAVFLQKNEFPYVLSRKNLKSKIYYSCVGGGGFVRKNDIYHLDKVAEELKKIDGISVRDFRTQELLVSKGVAVRLIPDSALIISDIYPPAFLSSRGWRGKVRVCDSFSFDNYIVFQGGKDYIAGKEAVIASQLLDISTRAGCSILLLPIGRATGHEDQVVLERIFESLIGLGAPCAMQDGTHVFDIMASLAFGKGYIGTSLHGAITAYTYGHKVCGIMTGKVRKLNDFVLTWMHKEDYVLVQGLDFAESFLLLHKHGSSIVGEDSLCAQKILVREELGRYLVS